MGEFDVVIRNARIVNATAKMSCDIGICGGRVIALGPSLRRGLVPKAFSSDNMFQKTACQSFLLSINYELETDTDTKRYLDVVDFLVSTEAEYSTEEAEAKIVESNRCNVISDIET